MASQLLLNSVQAKYYCNRQCNYLFLNKYCEIHRPNESSSSHPECSCPCYHQNPQTQHITSFLQSLNGCKMPERIEHEIISLTYITLKSSLLSYLCQFFTTNHFVLMEHLYIASLDIQRRSQLNTAKQRTGNSSSASVRWGQRAATPEEEGRGCSSWWVTHRRSFWIGPWQSACWEPPKLQPAPLPPQHSSALQSPNKIAPYPLGLLPRFFGTNSLQY